MGISIGASIIGADGETLDHLLIAADQAMYRAKSAHKTGALPLLTSSEVPVSASVVPSGEAETENLVTALIN
jgi:GGDEF domain-containing protein